MSVVAQVPATPMTDARPLDVPAVYGLYLGAIELPADRRLQAAASVMLTARAGLAPSEIEHLEASWLDRDRLAITIPAGRPCDCAACREATGEWTPPSNRAARTVPLGYSDRLAALAVAVADAPPADVEDLLEAAASEAVGLSADAIDGDRLAQTGVQFFLDIGLDREAIERLVGTDPWTAAVVRRPDAESAAALYRQFGRDRPAEIDPEVAFPLAGDPTPFENEPVDPTEAPEPTIDGSHVASLEMADGEFGQWVRRAERRRQGAPDPTPTATASAPDPADTPEQLLTKPLVANVTARFTTDAIPELGVAEGRILLGQEELLVFSATESAAFDDPETDRLLIPLDSVSDVGFDYVPADLSASFDASIAIAHRHGTDQHVLLIELAPSKQEKFQSVLFRLLFNVTPAAVAHPVAIDGSETGERATEMMLYVRPTEIKFGSPADDDRSFSIPLDRIVGVERDHEYVETDKRRVLYVTYLHENRRHSAMVGLEDDRLQTLFERFLKRSYQDTLNDLEGLRLSDGERTVLAALASADQRPDLSTLLDVDSHRLESLLETLTAKALVEVGEAGTVLTGRGYLAATDDR